MFTKTQQPVDILSQINSVRNLTSHFFKAEKNVNIVNYFCVQNLNFKLIIHLVIHNYVFILTKITLVESITILVLRW